MAVGDYAVAMRGITKAFGRTVVLRDVDLSVLPGEVHALVGQNGAGKSTLMNILGGVLKPDRGEIWIRGKKVVFHQPSDAQEAGIGFVYQEFALLPLLTVAQNILLGREPRTKLGTLDHKGINEQAETLLSQLGLQIDPRLMVASLTVAEQQLVQIAKALSLRPQVIVMDEPTACLSTREVERLFSIIRGLREHGVTVIYITHRLSEVFSVADRVSVLKDGRYVGTRDTSQLSQDELVSMMVGGSASTKYPVRERACEPEIALAVDGLSRPGVLRNVSLRVKRGEIVGIAGLVGSGRTELARAIFGADPGVTGEVRVYGRKVVIRSPKDAIRAGIGFVTEDRKAEGLVSCLPVGVNISMASLERFARLGFLQKKLERREVSRVASSVSLAADLGQNVARLSGGNQQKVVLSKWLLRNPQVFIFDEPTRGIDVGARREFYKVIRSLADQGAGVLMISSDLPEVLGMSDRVLVMRGGAIVAEFQSRDVDEQTVLKAAAGLHETGRAAR